MIKRNDDTEINLLFQECDALLCGRDEFSNFNEVEKIGSLNLWRDRLINWSDACQDSLDAEGLPFHEQNTEDKEWIVRADSMINRIDNAVDSLSKDPDERTMAERIYGGS